MWHPRSGHWWGGGWRPLTPQGPRPCGVRGGISSPNDRQSWSPSAGLTALGLVLQVMDLLFDRQKGLGMNFVRYNIGGGENPDPHYNSLRPGADVQVLQRDRPDRWRAPASAPCRCAVPYWTPPIRACSLPCVFRLHCHPDCPELCGRPPQRAPRAPPHARQPPPAHRRPPHPPRDNAHAQLGGLAEGPGSPRIPRIRWGVTAGGSRASMGGAGRSGRPP